MAPVTMREAVARVLRSLSSARVRPYVVTAVNAHFVVTAQREWRLQQFLNAADLCVADGVSLIISSRLLGARLPERITGVDLMVHLCEKAAQWRKSVYLLGGRDGAAEKAAIVLQNMFPELRIVGADRPPMGRESDPVEVQALRGRIKAASPDFLFVCFGVPLQEYWIEMFTTDLPVGVVMGNGAALDVIAGHFSRPPKWMQDLCLEWLFRLSVEPKRLWRRYILGNSRFIYLILKQVVKDVNLPLRVRRP